ncbi:flagella basal body P-ring formation protein FlgA [Caulobacter segnis]|uniref:Flagella basal body P-ring formation protein FlgA n=2 Tax=Caulobacter segnis TaxID=88688 RepID=D5VIP2_CAUST|nr:flagellar basal body P-ring formation chaperone FlgA [Caulobacter segnis]ADG09858.1 flagella basal body P-ring formation protein FlgA [Caulobacter segnis ATCC 21756]AVQ01618.1 flagella basal body P-ring formation protein FlgA [Caulobacter segnis]
MKALLFAAAALAFASPALAGTPVSLRMDTTDSDGRITLGDLFDGVSGAAANLVVAARMGPTAVLEAGQVQMFARRAGFDWDNSQGVRRIIVREGSDNSGGSTRAGLTGAARGNVEVLAYARSMTAGEIVQPEDLVWVKMAGAPADAPRDADAVIGLAAKRPLREGAAVSQRDVGAAQVVKTGDLITVTYSDGGISLSLQGKAMSAASTGEVFAVQNTASKKIIQAVAIGPGAAAVGPQAQGLQARSQPVRFAAR